MLKKLPFIIPLLALIALLVWWFTPHYTADEEAYYRAVFCMIDHDDSRQFLHDMQNIVEGGNSDYALHKTHYLPANKIVLLMTGSLSQNIRSSSRHSTTFFLRRNTIKSS